MAKKRVQKRKQQGKNPATVAATATAVPHGITLANNETPAVHASVSIETGEGAKMGEVSVSEMMILPDVMLESDSDHSQATDTVAPELASLKKMWGVVEKKKAVTSPLSPSPVQLKSWSVMLNLNHAHKHKNNLIAIAPTGSGKTLAYGLSILASSSGSIGIQGVCLVPTRELARQVEKELKYPAKAVAVRLVCVYGGQDRDDQIGALKKAKHCAVVVVATPGRLLDLLEERSDLRKMCSSVKHFLLDEADCLAKNIDSCQQIESIRRVMPPNVQTSLFSATEIKSVSQKWDKWVAKPRAVIKVENRTMRGDLETSDNLRGELSETQGVAQQVHTAAKKQKLESATGTGIPLHVSQVLCVCTVDEKRERILSTIATIRQNQAKRNPGLTIVFFATVKGLQSVLKLLAKQGVGSCSEYHSKMSQTKRERALAEFRSGKSTILLATDIAARGIHVNNLEFVVNFDFPDSLEQYVHRCGRAGRKQKDGTRAKGTVYSFFTADRTPMARHMVDILSTTNSFVDPKLIALTEGCK